MFASPLEDAIAYLQLVKRTLPKANHDQFVDALARFKAKRLSPEGLNAEAHVILAPAPSLVTGFNMFLPPELRSAPVAAAVARPALQSAPPPRPTPAQAQAQGQAVPIQPRPNNKRPFSEDDADDAPPPAKRVAPVNLNFPRTEPAPAPTGFLRPPTVPGSRDPKQLVRLPFQAYQPPPQPAQPVVRSFAPPPPIQPPQSRDKRYDAHPWTDLRNSNDRALHIGVLQSMAANPGVHVYPLHVEVVVHSMNLFKDDGEVLREGARTLNAICARYIAKETVITNVRPANQKTVVELVKETKATNIATPEIYALYLRCNAVPPLNVLVGNFRIQVVPTELRPRLLQGLRGAAGSVDPELWQAAVEILIRAAQGNAPGLFPRELIGLLGLHASRRQDAPWDHLRVNTLEQFVQVIGRDLDACSTPTRNMVFGLLWGIFQAPGAQQEWLLTYRLTPHIHRALEAPAADVTAYNQRERLVALVAKGCELVSVRDEFNRQGALRPLCEYIIRSKELDTLVVSQAVSALRYLTDDPRYVRILQHYCRSEHLKALLSTRAPRNGAEDYTDAQSWTSMAAIASTTEDAMIIAKAVADRVSPALRGATAVSLLANLHATRSSESQLALAVLSALQSLAEHDDPAARGALCPAMDVLAQISTSFPPGQAVDGALGAAFKAITAECKTRDFMGRMLEFRLPERLLRDRENDASRGYLYAIFRNAHARAVILSQGFLATVVSSSPFLDLKGWKIILSTTGCELTKGMKIRTVMLLVIQELIHERAVVVKALSDLDSLGKGTQAASASECDTFHTVLTIHAHDDELLTLLVRALHHQDASYWAHLAPRGGAALLTAVALRMDVNATWGRKDVPYWELLRLLTIPCAGLDASTIASLLARVAESRQELIRARGCKYMASLFSVASQRAAAMSCAPQLMRCLASCARQPMLESETRAAILSACHGFLHNAGAEQHGEMIRGGAGEVVAQLLKADSGNIGLWLQLAQFFDLEANCAALRQGSLPRVALHLLADARSNEARGCAVLRELFDDALCDHDAAAHFLPLVAERGLLERVITGRGVVNSNNDDEVEEMIF